MAARQARDRLLHIVKDCEAVLVDEAVRQGTKTLELPAGKAVLTGGPESELQWDIEILEQLRELGLPEPTVRRAREDRGHLQGGCACREAAGGG